MKNVRIAFELFEDGTSVESSIKTLKDKGYQQIDFHIIFDIKVGDNFSRKARMVAGGHKTSTPITLTYAYFVSRDSMSIVFLVAALHGLEILASDIHNVYLNVPCREKVFTIAGPEFGSEYSQIFIIIRALYGHKSSGSAFRSFLAEHLHDTGYRPCKADPDVWMRPALNPNGFKYLE